jgi:hypothetical protein
METSTNLKEWAGRQETVTDTITATPYAALSADARPSGCAA